MEKIKITAPTYNELMNLYLAKEIYLPDSNELTKE